jgi:putative phosphoesterase
MNIGVISDTHGVMRANALEALQGSDLIVHAGDVGSPAILEALGEIAPVVAVRGNCDKESWAVALPESDVFEADSAYILVLHDLNALHVNCAAAGIGCVISGHSHKPAIVEKDGVLYLNPGSAGPRRFHLPVTVARIEVSGGNLKGEIITLEEGI